MSISEYTIDVPDEKIEKLRQKIAASTWTDELEESRWDLGAPLKDVERLAKYWQSGFDWKHQEAKLNELPNFQTSVLVDGFGQLDVHFVHQRSPVKGAIPLLFCHGCEAFAQFKYLA